MEYRSIYDNFGDIIKIIQTQIPDVEVSEIPIGPSVIEDNTTQIWLMPEVVKEYFEMVNLINVDSTAKEYPFILLGNHKYVEDIEVILFEKLVYGYKSDQMLEDKIVNFDSDILTNTVYMPEYEIVSIGHTHPKLGDELLKDKVALNLSDNIKNSNGIRRVGLNLSIQDFIQYECLCEQIVGKEVFQIILMYNGELNIIGNKEGKYYKFSDVIGLTRDEYIEIPVVKFDDKRLVK